ncbi:hypothetical protein FKR81_16395 [Lentzea tibetensis]|uniref:Uncharacterized protein n=1 Tax=Lentzea tibetensis TaxID=2591470 RepID=A0A563EUJ0_9PSEU|nr:hypothetical protein [Lentzea tibetensis]TWP51198.1 hypothetical protein FKR81_16395 [Lentzea tibetensis]
MSNILAAFSDRLLSAFVPKAQARAAAPCTEASWCQLCDYVGSMPRKQYCYIAGSCSVIHCGQCLINNPQC